MSSLAPAEKGNTLYTVCLRDETTVHMPSRAAKISAPAPISLEARRKGDTLPEVHTVSPSGLLGRHDKGSVIRQHVDVAVVLARHVGDGVKVLEELDDAGVDGRPGGILCLVGMRHAGLGADERLVSGVLCGRGSQLLSPGLLVLSSQHPWWSGVG